MNVTIEYNAKGGYRFNHLELLPVGKYFLYLGEKVKVVGQGMAGFVEVIGEDGIGSWVSPFDLKEIN